MKEKILKTGISIFVILFFCNWQEPELSIRNGWITFNNKVIMGNGQRTDYWGGYKECQGNLLWINSYKTYTAITRNYK